MFHVLTRRPDVFPLLLMNVSSCCPGQARFDGLFLTASPRHVELASASSYSWEDSFGKMRKIVTSIS